MNLEIARELYFSGDPEGGEAAYLAGADAIRSDSAVVAYRRNVAWAATPSELAAFDSLGPGEYRAWLNRFWHRRDAAEARRSGERLAEHFRRLEYAMANFRLGPVVAEFLLVCGGGFTAAGAQPDDAPPPPAGFDAAGGSLALPAFSRSRRMLEDRAVIYMRFGEPDKRAIAPPACPNESWKYLRPAGSLILHFMGADFDGSSAATTLVSALPPGLFESRCGLDTRFCLMGGLLEIEALRPEHLVKERRRAREAIATATTTDAFPLRFDRPLEPVLQAAGLVRERGVVVLQYAIPGQQLSASEGDGGATVYMVDLRVVTSGPEGEGIAVLDTTRVVTAERPLEEGQFLIGQLEWPVEPGRRTLRVVVRQEEDNRGTALRLPDVSVPEAPSDSLYLSDILIGRSGSGLTWSSPGGPLPLNPLGTFPEGATAEVYYQATGLVPGQTYETTLEVRRREGGNDRDRISLAFEEVARTAFLGSTRSIQLSTLRPGNYVLTLRVGASHAAERLERTAEFVIVEGS